MTTEALRILAIDHTPDNLIALKAVVRDALPGTAVITALDGPQGLALALAEAPDVILLDIVLPGMDGYAVCRALKADDHLRHIPVVFLIALRADRESRLQALEAGAEGFLARPLDEVELSAQIRAMAKIKAANRMQRLEREQSAAQVAERTAELERELAERVRVEETLRESEARYRQLVELSRDLIAIHRQGEIVFINEAGARMVGATSPDQIVGKSVLEFIPASRREIAQQRMSRLPEDGRSPVYEQKLRRLDGTEVDIEAEGIPFRYQGEVAIQLVVHDITERRLAEEALRESEERYRALFENVSVGVALISPRMEILALNRRMREWFPAITPEQHPICYGAFNSPPRNECCSYCPTRQTLADGQWHEAVTETPTPNGIRHYRVASTALTGLDGKVVAAIEMVDDITERKRTEEALRESEAKARRLLEQQIAINQLALALGESLNLEEVYQTIHKHIQGMMDVWCFIISSYDEQAKLIRAEYAAADQGYDVAEFPPIPLGAPGTGTQSRVIHTGQPLYTPDHREALCPSNVRYTVEQNGSVHEELPSEQDEEDTTRSVVYLPMKVKGQTVGILQVQSRRLNAYSADDINLLAGMANVAAVAIQNAKLHEEVLRELEERKRAEAALREGEERYRLLVENINDTIYTLDTAGKFTYVSPVIERFSGYKVADLTDRPFTEFVHPDDLTRLLESYGRTLRGEIEPLEYRIFDRDGSVRHIRTSSRLLYDNGVFVGTTGVIADITERARLLAQVQAQAQQIAQLMDTVPEGVLLLDADGLVLLANPAGMRDLATLAGVAVGERLTHLGDLPLAELFAAAARGGSWHELQAGRRSFEAIARPVVAGSPTTGHWVLVINDVTQVRDIRDQLQQQERLAAVGQLAAGIAHDFNNILAIIALQAPLVARAPGLTERDRERLTVISEQTADATRLIQQLLDFSRRAVLERRPLDLVPLLQEQVKLLARTLPETIEVTLDCEPGEYVVLADPTRLQQALMNLAVNARDAMPAGGTLRLTLVRQATAPRPDLPAGPWIRLAVADSGTGIAPEALAHLFEPFFTTKPRGQGTGLGLAQVHGIVKQHGGEIEVHSAADQGATFTIYLPAVAEAAVAPAPAGAAAAGGAEQMILIVEDNAVLLDAMADTVELLGYRVVGAGNGAEALAVLEAQGNAIALVLSDLVMPVMGGEALLRAMRTRGLTTPVVMLSGHPLEGELAGLKMQGLAGWLLKPPDLDDLARLLAQTIADC